MDSQASKAVAIPTLGWQSQEHCPVLGRGLSFTPNPGIIMLLSRGYSPLGFCGLLVCCGLGPIPWKKKTDFPFP